MALHLYPVVWPIRSGVKRIQSDFGQAGIVVGWRPSLVGWRPSLLGLEAIAL